MILVSFTLLTGFTLINYGILEEEQARKSSEDVQAGYAQFEKKVWAG